MEVVENLGVEAAGLRSSGVEMRVEVVVAGLTADFDYPGDIVKGGSNVEKVAKTLAGVEAVDRKNRAAEAAEAAEAVVHRDTTGEEEEEVEAVGFSADHNVAGGN